MMSTKMYKFYDTCSLLMAVDTFLQEEEYTPVISSITLKELENDGLIIRKEYPQVPPKVEYSLSEKGKTLIPILDLMCQWGEKNLI